MKYDNLRAFEKHLESSSPHHFACIYLICAKEAAENKEAVDILLKYLIPGDRTHALFVSEAGSVSTSQILTELNSPSFLAPKRAIWIQQTDKLKKELQESLENYLDHPQPSAFLILSSSSLQKNSSFYKKAEKAGIILELQDAKPWEKEKILIEWVSKQTAAARKIMPHPAIQSLVKQTGSNRTLLEQELEKLFCYVGEKNEITLQDVKAICTNASTETIWQLGEAVMRCNATAALHICQSLLNEGNALLPLLRQIRSQLQTGYQICTILASGGHSADVAREYPYMKGQILDRNVQQAQHYGLIRFRKGLLAIDEAEMQAKNSQLDDSLLAELLMIKLTK